MNVKYKQPNPSVQPPQMPCNAPMRALSHKEIKQVAGGPGGFPLLGPKKP
jgi:hypothetical protein